MTALDASSDRNRRERVRFGGLTRSEAADHQIVFTVALEWDDEEYVGTASGSRGDAVELRTVANAALAAIAKVALADLDIRLAGIKIVRAFDAELVIVALYRADQPGTNLVGAVVAGEDPPRAAAMAVLSALNRLLGNYLVT